MVHEKFTGWESMELREHISAGPWAPVSGIGADSTWLPSVRTKDEDQGGDDTF